MKAAVYAGTRNLYSDMVTAAKSLAINSSVEHIYFLIEDPVFPHPLPNYISCIDVSGQTYFNKRSPNIYKLWTWMVLMRAALTKIFPEFDQILSLDIDTIVRQNIDELWDLDLNGYDLAGVPEPEKSKENAPYINMGVVMFNLKELRESERDDQIIKFLNIQKFEFAEQDCINRICKDHILELPSTYNSERWTEPCDNPKIVHFAAEQFWNTKEIVKTYRNIPWKEIR